MSFAALRLAMNVQSDVFERIKRRANVKDWQTFVSEIEKQVVSSLAKAKREDLVIYQTQLHVVRGLFDMVKEFE